MIKENYDDGYYHVGKDIEVFPDNWCYVIWSHRGPGKTYGSLLHSLINKIPIIYMKRTIEDVNLICSSNEYGFDPSPYVPINRDHGTNIKAVKIKDGIGAFYHMQDGEPIGAPVSYILAMNAIKRFKGFDFSICDWVIMDEFIPQIGERINNKEGELLLDLYMTISRDREKRGRDHLKLILFANAEEISTPITNTLEIVDCMADMNANDINIMTNENGIFLHHLTRSEFPITENEKTGIYAAMKNTAWGAKSFEGSFANNDFSNVKRVPLRHYRCMYKLHYKTHDYYIYVNNSGCWYMCRSRNKPIFSYDLNKENDQKRFYVEQWLDLRDYCVNDKFKFESYSMYDLIINYRKFFKI